MNDDNCAPANNIKTVLTININTAFLRMKLLIKMAALETYWNTHNAINLLEVIGMSDRNCDAANNTSS